MKILISKTAAFALVLACGPVLAGVPTPPPAPTFTTTVIGQDNTSEDEFFVGLNWQFGAHSQPELVVGYRDLDVSSNGDVDGFGLDFTFPLTKGFRPGELRLKGIDGDEDLQGEFGLGWSFAHQGFLLTGGAQGRHFTAGTDYVFGTGWQPYLGVNTVGEYDVPPYLTETTASCPSPFVLAPGGQTCQFPSNGPQ
ncbi:hypothetical protein [Arenimonas alkanexedens]